MPQADPAAQTGPDAQAVEHVLRHGVLTVTGRLTDASNVTLLGTVDADGLAVDCVYKPVRGERPLWDFPDGTLAEREVAAYELAEYAGWGCVPTTVLRDGPLGTGMVQRWIDLPEDADELVDLVPAEQVPDGWLPVLRAEDGHGRPIVVVHADSGPLAVLAAFDLVVNNADRKGSHVLAVPDGPVFGVDHGLTFHQEDKLRTILWGWAGRPLPEPVTTGLDRLADGLAGDFGERMAELMTTAELATLRQRVTALRRRPVFPHPPTDRYPIPWPPL